MMKYRIVSITSNRQLMHDIEAFLAESVIYFERSELFRLAIYEALTDLFIEHDLFNIK
jgi:metal-responsive CopG/Arc/MetJ family transcriptional regulator